MLIRRYSSSINKCIFFLTCASISTFLLLNLSIYKYESIQEVTLVKITNPLPIRIKTHTSNFTTLIDIINSNNEIKNKHFLIQSLDNTKYYANNSLIVILIQVHTRVFYLKSVIESLRRTKHINETLIVFSHDFNSTEINELVDSIEFCSYAQIFYPYSLQNYPKEFPGANPNDCPQRIKKEDAIKKRCNNAYYPDTFNNYRNHEIVQIKHHWFWKLSYVFEHLNSTKDYENLVVLLIEEDNYVLPDALHTLILLREKILSDIDIVSLAIFDHSKPLQQKPLKANDSDMFKYKKGIFQTTKHTVGFTLARVQWEMIKNCSNKFCELDEYNWDYSLEHISKKCFKLPLVAIYPSVSRIIHFGHCGVHSKKQNCSHVDQIKEYENYYVNNNKYFFPINFSLASIDDKNYGRTSTNGGWGDPRDKQLCKLFPYEKSINLSNIVLPISLPNNSTFQNKTITNRSNSTN